MDRPEEAPHGFDLAAADRALLRGAPPPAALQWAAGCVGVGAGLVSCAPLEGGTSSAIHALVVRDRGGGIHDLVLRRFVRPDWLAEEPDGPRREATVLEVLRACAVPAPRLVGVDPDGAVAGGAPAVLMTRLPGRIDWRPDDLRAYIAGLAAALPPIHATPVAAGTALPPYAPYRVSLHRGPRWSTQPEVWRRALQVLTGPPPAVGRRLIHRDYHPGNVLWQGGRVSGVVDWVCGSLGVPEADLGHCRANLHGRFGAAVADGFLEAHRALTGRREYHPYWDIAAALGGMDTTCPAPSLADEDFLAAAVARL